MTAIPRLDEHVAAIILHLADKVPTDNPSWWEIFEDDIPAALESIQVKCSPALVASAVDVLSMLPSVRTLEGYVAGRFVRISRGWRNDFEGFESDIGEGNWDNVNSLKREVPVIAAFSEGGTGWIEGVVRHLSARGFLEESGSGE